MFNVNRAQAAASLRRLAGLDVAVACFGHGEPVTHDAAAALQAAAERPPIPPKWRVIFSLCILPSSRSTNGREGPGCPSTRRPASGGIPACPCPRPHRDLEQVLRRAWWISSGPASNVVLDFSFWSCAMRDEYRELLRPLGLEPEGVPDD